MIEKAEQEGKLKPGGTIVEPTSGNTGVGLAIAAAQKGYRCIFVMPDKMSQEKISMLRGYGAEVVITPTAVEHDSPESYYSVSSRLAEEIPGGFKPDQYSNMANPQAHYERTGPEIFEQTDGEIDALIISVGTGGTISGVGRYFKEHAPHVLTVGADPGGSAGTTLYAAYVLAQRLGPGKRVLMLVPDSGRSYLSKIYDDNWMLEHGFVERHAPSPSVEEVLRAKHGGDVPALITISAHQK